MFIIPSGIPTSSAAGAYVPAYALRLDGSADYLSWIPSQAGNRNAWTLSLWFKLSEVPGGTGQTLLSCGTSTNEDYLRLDGDGRLQYRVRVSSSDTVNNLSNGLYKDPASWYHLVVRYDNGVSSNTCKIYVNGDEITFSSSNEPSGSESSNLNNTVAHNIGRRVGGTDQYFDGYIAEVILLDGVLATAASFGETDSTTGIWVPKDPTDSSNISDWGGQNSFYMNFADGNNLGKDAKPTAITANPGTYKIDHSLWFDGSADNLSDGSPSGSGNAKKWTLSFWLKRSKVDSSQVVFGSGDWDADYTSLYFSSSGVLNFDDYSGGSAQTRLVTNALYRDTSSWYNIILSYDSTPSAPSSSSIKLIVNGTQITSFSTETYASQNDDTTINTTAAITFGDIAVNSPSLFLNGYLADINFIDGLALSADSFGGYDAKGIWMPVDPTGLTYGTNGYRLDFHDTSALGEDVKNNNDFTVNGTMAASQRTTDSPTNTAADNEGNYATLNPLDKHATYETLSEGNLKTVGSNPDTTVRSTIALGTTGKWYWEMTANDSSGIYTGVCLGSKSWTTGGGVTTGDNNAWQYNQNAKWYGDGAGSGATYGNAATWTTNDVIGVAYDATSGTIWCSKNDSWIDGNGTDSSGTVKAEIEAGTTSSAMKTGIDTSVPIFACSSDSGSKTRTFNFGQTAFAGSAPSGFKALATHNMSEVTIDPRAHFAPVIYTGTGLEGRTVRGCFDSEGTAWTPDLVWIKSRSDSADHVLYDSVRGVSGSTAGTQLSPNLTAAEPSTTGGHIQSFESGGFRVKDGTAGNADHNVNDASATYVAWCWKAGGTAVTDADGMTKTSDSSTTGISISANTTAGFSIIKYAGNGAASTIAHGLGAVPKMIIIKNIGTTEDWVVYHEGLGAGHYLRLNTDGDKASDTGMWLNATPSSSTFNVAAGYTKNNESGEDYIAYVFAEIEGFSKFGSYTGNGNTSGDGPFIFTGMKPAFLLVKRTDTANNWGILDASRNPYNPVELVLYTDLSQAEAGSGNEYVSFTSNGFKITNDSTANWINATGGTYIYAAFAESPFANNNRGR